MKKITLALCLLLAVATTTASAAVKITQKDVDTKNRCLKISGDTEKAGAVVSINIPDCEMSAEDLEAAETPGDYIFYSDELVCDEKGVFSAQIDFLQDAKEGKYTVYVGGRVVGTPEKFAVWFAEESTSSAEVEKLNELAKKESLATFKTELEQSGWKAGLANDTETDKNDILVRIVYDYVKENGLSKDIAKNSVMYDTALTAQLLSEEKIAEAEKLMSTTLIEKDILDDYDKYIDSEEEKQNFVKIFADCSTVEEFENSFLDAIILTVVKYADGTADIKEIFAKHAKYIGAEIKNAGLDDYSYISGDTFSTVKSLAESFNKHVKNSANSNNSGGGSGGGSGGSGGGGGGTSVNVGAILNSDVTIVNNTTPEEINIKFEDLNPVPWAYTAISKLFTEGIVHGRSETRFAPNEPVKREEFVKMLIEMADIEVLEYENVFADVDSGAWYAKYVNTAYQNGVCNGTGSGNFGIGNNISREDMCVMAYNVLSKITDISAGENSFADENLFSSYSIAPVKALNAAGIVNGVGDNNFNPKGNATRAEASVIIYNTLCYIQK